MKIGSSAFATLLFLFTLMTLSAFLFSGRLAVAIEDQSRAGAAPAAVAPAEPAVAVRQEAPPPRVERIPSPPPVAAVAPRRRPAPSGAGDAAGLERELAALQSAIDEHRAEHAALEHERATLADRLAAVEALSARVGAARLSREEKDRRLADLRQQIAKLAADIGAVHRELTPRDAVSARRLVPAGSRKAAAFVECDADGVLLMPERTRLQASVPPADRETFLARARATGYVVFLIRPDGFKTFDRYRDVVEAHNKTGTVQLEYGYEPVNADWKLRYPDRGE